MSANPSADALPDLPDLEAETVEPHESTVVAETPATFASVNDVPVTVSAVLGKTKIDVASLMRLGDGAVIELDRKVGEPIDLYVNDQLIARGELVMVDGSLGVTMTEIVKRNEL